MAMERKDGHLGNLGRFCGTIWLTSRSMEDKKVLKMSKKIGKKLLHIPKVLLDLF